MGVTCAIQVCDLVVERYSVYLRSSIETLNEKTNYKRARSSYMKQCKRPTLTDCHMPKKGTSGLLSTTRQRAIKSDVGVVIGVHYEIAIKMHSNWIMPPNAIWRTPFSIPLNFPRSKSSKYATAFQKSRRIAKKAVCRLNTNTAVSQLVEMIQDSSRWFRMTQNGLKRFRMIYNIV